MRERGSRAGHVSRIAFFSPANSVSIFFFGFFITNRETCERRIRNHVSLSKDFGWGSGSVSFDLALREERTNETKQLGPIRRRLCCLLARTRQAKSRVPQVNISRAVDSITPSTQPIRESRSLATANPFPYAPSLLSNVKTTYKIAHTSDV
ncbi:hypothetical protein LZ31DRAFT_236665 [Colletotrichum somersetense]|nr:hypothetical protein LZ31DRAFT_236665 [Colletotrichum somersetense]